LAFLLSKEFFCMGQNNQYLWGVTSRVIVGVVGGYCCCIASSFALAPLFNLAFDMPKPDAVYLATLLSYLFYLTAIIWSFCQRTALLAWRDIIISSVLLSLSYILAVPVGGVMA
jgi:heme exporter protein D